MNNVVVIWEEVPEALEIRRLVNLSEEDYKKLLGFHGEMCSQSEEALDWEWIQEFLKKGELLYSSEASKEFPAPEVANVTIVHTGILL